jgi:capsid portal protein
MDKRDGSYLNEGETLELGNQANEILDFTVGRGYYGTPRWMGQALTVDGDFRAEKLNNNYFRNGRHTPLMIMIQGGTLSDESFEKLQHYMDDIKGESGQHAFIILETEKNETTTDFADDNQPTIQVKDMAGILQTDGLFQEYQDKGRRKVQSAFLLPDLYVGYTTDFNRATAQTAMEITEKQVFQPERASLAWKINNKLLDGYGFKYVEAIFNSPDITNPDDIYKILTIAEKAGGVTMNDARSLAMQTLGKEAEDYPNAFDMADIGNVPLSVINTMTALKQYGAADSTYDSISESQKDAETDEFLDSEGKGDTVSQLDDQIEKAMINHDDDVVAVMKEVRKTLAKIGGD